MKSQKVLLISSLFTATQNTEQKTSRTGVLFFLTSLILIMFILVGCQPAIQNAPRLKDGKEYGVTKGSFRHKWWNYYERGLSYADGKFYDEALEDLKTAMSRRKNDQRMARTYGMHFVDYFPNREMGIIHYFTGEFETAKEELTRSINQYPSAKAHFYLDRVRVQILKQTAKTFDPPKIHVALPLNFSAKNFYADTSNDWILSAAEKMVISGKVEDKNFVSGLSIHGKPVFMEESAVDVPFSKEVYLFHGDHEIEIKAVNLMGKTSVRKLKIRVDMYGPLITIKSVEHTKTGYTINGSIYDESGIGDLSLDGQKIEVGNNPEILFSEQVLSKNDFTKLSAADRLGNRTLARIALSQTQKINPVSGRLRMIAGIDSDIYSQNLLSLFGPKDKDGPLIQLTDWTDNQTVFLEKIYLAGQISDDSQIEKLSINGVSVLRHKGQSIFFNHVAAIEEGDNLIIVNAVDEHGNESEMKVKVIRKIPRALQLEERLSISVLLFEQKGEISDTSRAFQEQMINALVDRDRFNVLERERLDAVLKEQKLSATKLFDKTTAIKLGKLVAAEHILTGTFTETATGVEIVGRMIDTETSKILATEDVYDEIKDLQAMKTLAVGMAIKFHRKFPLTEGIVLMTKGKHVFTDLGEGNIALQRKLIVYREEVIKHPVTGKVFGADNIIIGIARVVQVSPDMSKARLSGDKPLEIKPMDKVITK